MARAKYHLKLRHAFIELSLVLGCLALVILFLPLGSTWFLHVTVAICAATLSYLLLGLWLFKGIGERWGLSLGGLKSDQAYQGCLFIGSLFLVSLAPIVILRLLVVIGWTDLPQIAHPAAYLVWCVVQDFLFFSLIMRDLEDVTHPFLALLVTALLFGAAHYPYDLFMFVTALVGVCWGYLFLLTRSLPLITLSHWLMGVLILG